MIDRQQPLRNALHLATGVAAPWIMFAPRGWALAGLVLVLVVTGAVDLGRRRPGFRRALDARLPGVFRLDEGPGVSGATLLAAGYLLAAAAFPAPAAAGGILALAVGDPAAAVIGRWYAARIGRQGKLQSNLQGKTWAGSLACFTVTWLVLWAVPPWSAAVAAAGAAMAALVERRSGRLDNLLIPAGVALLLNLWIRQVGTAAVLAG